MQNKVLQAIGKQLTEPPIKDLTLLDLTDEELSLAATTSPPATVAAKLNRIDFNALLKGCNEEDTQILLRGVS